MDAAHLIAMMAAMKKVLSPISETMIIEKEAMNAWINSEDWGGEVK